MQLILELAAEEDDKIALVLATLSGLCCLRKGEILGIKYGDL